MKTALSAEQLGSLLAIVSSHGRLWQTRTGRQLAKARDMIDFLVDSRDAAPLWEDLEQWQRQQGVDLGMARVRASLPAQPFPSDHAASQCLVAMGISAAEADAILSGIDEQALVESSLQSAFDTLTPAEVASRLERMASEDHPAEVARQYVDRVPVRSKRAWVIALLIGGGVLFLAGTAATCAAVTVLYKGVTF